MTNILAEEDSQLHLKSTIRGHSEQPQMIFIVPWKDLEPTIPETTPIDYPPLKALSTPTSRQEVINITEIPFPKSIIEEK